MSSSIFFPLALVASLVVPLSSAVGEIVRFNLVPRESRILTRVAHPFGPVKGALILQEGTAAGDIEDLQATAHVKLVIAASSYDSGLGLRDQDVQESYLEAVQYPLIIFTGRGFEGTKQPAAGIWQTTINGRLELHGMTKEVSVPIKLTRQERKITVEGSLRVLFKDFNIPVPKLLFLRAGDLADVEFRFVAEQEP